jgi:phosphatidate cytidylyltransferase
VLIRVLTAATLIPPVLAVLWFNPFGRSVFVLVALLSAGMSYELVRLANHAGSALNTYDFALMWLATLAWMLSVGQPLVASVEPFVGITLIIGAFLPSLATGRVDGGATRAAWVVLGALYIGDCFARHALLLYEVNGGRWLFATLAAVWACDTSAYVVGKHFGHTRLAPEISAAKTWEGAAAGLLGAIVGGTVAAVAFDSTAWRVAIGGSTLVGIVGQAGDLAESLLKRCASVKDSGNLVPGHGGLLDRLDSLVFAIPAVYWYLRFAGVGS